MHELRGPAHSPSRGYGRAIPSYYLYPSPTDSFPASPLYSVNVSILYRNGTVALPGTPSHVYYNSMGHRASYPGVSNAIPGQSVSWTSVAFDDSLFTAVVTVQTTFPVRACILRPRSYGLACNFTVNATTVSIALPRTMLKISVELIAPEAGNTPSFIAQPLFLFPDPPEDPALVPPPTDPGVLYFARGVHNVSGGQMSLPCGVNNVYLEPGAFVSGGFKTTCTGGWFSAPETVVFSGRGVISGEAFPWHSPLFTWALVNIDLGVGNVVDGLTLVDSPEFYLASFSHSPTIRNVKMLGSWPYNSDGFDAGNGGLVEDCFVRANDDSIKISGPQGAAGAVVQRIVVWQMINGAVVQLGWISPLPSRGVVVRDIDVIHVQYCSTSQGWCMGSNNEAVVDLAPDGTQLFSLADISIENVRVEGDAVRLVYVQAPAGSSGSVVGLTLTDVSADEESLPSVMGGVNYVGSLSSSTAISGLGFVNVTVGGTCWEDAGVARLKVEGAAVSAPSFSCPPSRREGGGDGAVGG
jgi:hypothetical protein